MEEFKSGADHDVHLAASSSRPPTSNINTSSSTLKLNPELPLLPYNLRDHKLSIILYWSAIFAESFALPIGLYYGLSNSTDMRPGAYFAIITAMFGFVTGFEYAMRGWRLIKKSDNYRPLNESKRFWGFDSVHWILSGPYFVMTAVMIGVSIPDPPKTRGLAVILPIGMTMIGSMMFASGIAHSRGWKLPFRLSSHTKGSPWPPLTFSILEDIVGCDGRGGKAFREAVMSRYNMSPQYRQMLVRLNWAWSLSALGVAVAVFAIVFSIREEIGYGLGWGIPTAWGLIGAFATTKWVQKSVRIERQLWESESKDSA